MPETTYEMLARERKALALARFLADQWFTAGEVRGFNDTQWAASAKLAHCKPPRSQATKDLVIRMLEEAAK